MPILYGQQIAPAALRERVGDIGQIAGVRRFRFDEGPAAGMAAVEVWTGSGLRFTVLPDRCLDLLDVSFNGMALGWIGPPGPVHPARYNARGREWLWTFSGGLLTTCGLSTAGAQGEDLGEQLGIHGRASALSAEQVAATARWEGDDYVLRVAGQMREAALFGPNLVLRRELRAALGGRSITITDTVENAGYATTPHMLLYHINLGWPLLDAAAELVSSALHVSARDAAAAPGLQQHARFSPPVPGYAEQVFYHDMLAGDDGFVTVRVLNRPLGLGLELRYRQEELPWFSQWKQVGQGAYVLGLEPANCQVEGRAAERARGTLQALRPGERREYVLHLRVLLAGEMDD
jgi:hypothetical protein